MAFRRFAVAAVAAAVALAAPACRFSRSSNELNPTSTSASTIDIFEETTTIPEDTTTVVETSTTRRVATTVRQAAATTRPAAPRTPTTARPVPTVPHCNVSAADTSYGSSWTATVTSTFPNSTVVIDISWPGGSGNYSGVTGADGSWTKTQRVQPAMRGQTISVSVSVGGRQCATSFRVS